MGVIKGYFKNQFNLRMFMLEHEDPSEFYLSAFQKNRSAVPLLVLRTVICFGCIAIIIASSVLSLEFMPLAYWPIFLTHWGLVLNAIAAIFGVLVSAKAYIQGPIDTISGLPRYVKMYWAMTNISTIVALFITVFYWTFLSDNDGEYAANRTLDVFIHVVNSILMLVMLLSAKQPFRILHFYQPVATAIVYLIFSIIYYYAGGTNPVTDGTYIYPTLDWSLPGLAMMTVFLSLILILILHFVGALLALLRDAISYPLLRDNKYSVYR